MVHNLSTASITSEQLAKTLGQILPGRELNRCLQSIKIQQPSGGKRFWQTANAEPGIYIPHSSAPQMKYIRNQGRTIMK